MWRVGKVLRFGRGKNLSSLPNLKKTLGKLSSLPSAKIIHSAKRSYSAKSSLLSAKEKTLGKHSSLLSVFILPSVFLIALGNELFVECSK